MLQKWRRSSRLAFLSLLVVTAIWGSTFVLVKETIAKVPVMDFLAVRFIVAAAVMLAVNPGCLRSVGRRTISRGVALGSALGAGYITQTIGLKYASAAVSGFITGMFVVFTPLLGGLLLKKRIGLQGWFAVLLSLVGLALIGLRGAAFGAGEILTIACALFFAFHIVGLGEWSSSEEPYGFALVQIALVGLVCLFSALPGGLQIPSDPGYWVAIVVTSVFATALAFSVQTWAQSILPPTTAALVLTMEPVFAGIFAV